MTGAIARVATRRPLLVIAVAVAVAVVSAVVALGLAPRTGTDTLVSSSSDQARATAEHKREFGDDSIVVLVRGPRSDALQRTLYSADLGRLIKLEGCLSGNVPEAGLKQLPRLCREVAQLDATRVVFGPGTFINTAVNRISSEFSDRGEASARESDRAAAAARRLSAQRGDPPAEQRRRADQARQLVEGSFTQQVLTLGLRYGLTTAPALNNEDFIDTLVFGPPRTGSIGVPKSRFAALFPSRRSAAIQVKLRPDLDDARRAEAIDLIRRATRDRAFRLEGGSRYVVTGVPVVVDGLAREVQRGIIGLLIAAIVLMAITLGLIFRSRLRLLPLLLALGSAATTFAALALSGGGLTMASIAVLPVLIGLAVDYAIQFQARFDEALERDRDGPRAAVVAAARSGGPTILTAALATAVGFLVLLTNPVPQVRDFGVLVVIGIGFALLLTVTAGFATLARFGGPPLPRRALPGATRLRGLRLRAIECGELVVARAVEHPGRVLAVGLAIAAVGWTLDTRATIVSDVRELVPADLSELRDVDALEAETGVTGEVAVAVKARDITSPAVVAWMTRFQDATVKAAGYEEGDRCAQGRDPPALCPGLSLTQLLASVDTQDQGQVRGLLKAIPAYYSQGVVTRDRRTASLAFGVRLQALSDQRELIDSIERRIERDPPPRGATANVVGFPALVSEANRDLASPLRRFGTLLAALLAVFGVLLAVRRRLWDAFVPLIPIAMATGWAAGVLSLLGALPGPLKVELNPMSVTLGALVIAITTEFSVLLSARYRAERDAGASPARAIEATYASTGPAVLASGVTATAGFAALIASDIRMLRDFGILTVVNLTISLIGVMIVLPAALSWSERRRAGRRADEADRVPAGAGP